jgi:hypothetical protein
MPDLTALASAKEFPSDGRPLRQSLGRRKGVFASVENSLSRKIKELVELPELGQWLLTHSQVWRTGL